MKYRSKQTWVVVLVTFFLLCPHRSAVAQCNTEVITITPTSTATGLLSAYQTFTAPQNGVLTSFRFYTSVPGWNGSFTYDISVYNQSNTLVHQQSVTYQMYNNNYYWNTVTFNDSTLYVASGQGFKINIAFEGHNTYTTNLGINTSVGGYNGSGSEALACGVSVAEPQSISFSQSSHSFGSETVGVPKRDSITLTNPGCYWLTISSASVGNSQFSITPASASIAAEGTQTFYVTYTPSGATTAADSVTFVSNAPANGTQKLPLSGTGAYTPRSSADNALTFDGSSSYLKSSTNPSIVNSSFTFEVWAKSATSSPSGWFFSQGTANTDQGLHIGYVSSTAIRFGMWSDDLDYTSVSDAANWHHFAFVFNAGTKFQAIYRDGLLIASRTANSNFTGTGNLYIGAIFTGTGSFSGTLEEARLWNTARTQTQIQTYMNRSLAGNESGLLGYWRFDETSGTTEIDATGHGYAEAFTNTPTRVPSGVTLGTTTAVTDSASGITAASATLYGLVNPYGDSSTVTFQYGTTISYGSSASADQSPVSGTSALPVTVTVTGLVSGTIYHYRTAAANSVDTAYGADSTFATPALLPVELTTFTASSDCLNANLQWQTATEVNNAGFEIQRSVSSEQVTVNSKNNQQLAAASWMKVGFVDGAGTSNAPHSYSFTDNVGTAGAYSYRLKQIDRNGAFTYSHQIEVQVGGAPRVFALGQNYPNPFNPTTVIQFTVPSNGRVVLKVYNTLGQEVATLFDGVATAGQFNQAAFDGSNLASGIYFSRLEFDGKMQVKKMLLLK